MKFTRILLLAISLAASLGQVACHMDKKQPNVELIQDMMDQPADKPQKYEDFFADHTSARVPPENTQPVGMRPYKYAKDPEGSKNLKNPFAASEEQDVLMTGQKFFETNCMVCHGMGGHGDGPVAAKFAGKQPPSLMTSKIRGWADGQIYNVITMGQGVMGSYASHVPRENRWQVVNYIRYLQKTEKTDETK